MQTSFCLALNGYSHISKGFNSWWLCKSGHRHTLQYMTCGSPFLCDTCNRPSSERGIVTHLLGCPGQLKAFSSSSKAPFFFFSFLTKESTAFSAHFSSSSPCFQPRSLLTAGLVNENKLFKLDMGELIPKYTITYKINKFKFFTVHFWTIFNIQSQAQNHKIVDESLWR